MTKEDVTKFYKQQNLITLIGGAVTISLMGIGYKSSSLIMFIGMLCLLITFLVCDVRETKFKTKFKGHDKK